MEKLELKLTFNEYRTAGTFVVLGKVEDTPPATGDPAPTPNPTPVVVPPGVRVIDRDVSSLTRIGQTIWKPGQIAVVRCRSGEGAPLGYVEARGFSGSTIGAPFSMSISTAPADFSVPSNAQDSGSGILKVIYGPGHAFVPPVSIVYISLRYNGTVAFDNPQANLGINIGGTFLTKP